MDAPDQRMGRAARLDGAVERWLARVLTRRGWRPRVVAYPCYGVVGTGKPVGADAPASVEVAAGDGASGWARVLARVLLLPGRERVGDAEGGRGWRRFFTAAVPDQEIRVTAGTLETSVTTGRGGYLDQVVPADLASGWREVVLALDDDRAPRRVAVRMVGPDERLGVISDVDDTVMVTALPRPLVAAWNTFVRREASRRPVPGMSAFLRAVRAQDPDAIVAYVSTGAWNVAPALVRFLARHTYPAGPLLMTDWGPTPDRYFRSGRAHKRAELRRLLRDLPHLSWVLLGDDGQHDPMLYDELVAEQPARVRLVAIRELTATEQVLTHGTATAPDIGTPAARGGQPGDGVPRIRGLDGHALVRELARLARVVNTR